MNAKQMIRTALAGAALALIGATAQAGAIGAGDLVINQLGVFNYTAGTVVNASTFVINSDSRVGSASSTYNGIDGTGLGAGTSTAGGGASVDVAYRCAGSDCGTISGLYGTVENNTAYHLDNANAPTATKNFALGDMFINGTALANTATGYTRADASAASATNAGGSAATIQNSARVATTFTSGASFTAGIVLSASAFTRAFVDAATPANEESFASGGVGFSLTIRDVTAGNSLLLSYAPDELNGNTGVFASTAGDNFIYSFSGNLASAQVNIIAGHTYTLVVSQSSAATVSEVPEPASLALVGVALLGLAGAATARRRQGK